MKLTIDSDSRTAQLSIDDTFDADELLALIGKLVRARAELSGEVDEASCTPVQLCAGPVDAGPAAGGMRLAIRHPEFGWVLTHVPLVALARLVATGASVLAAEFEARQRPRPTPDTQIQ